MTLAYTRDAAGTGDNFRIEICFQWRKDKGVLKEYSDNLLTNCGFRKSICPFTVNNEWTGLRAYWRVFLSSLLRMYWSSNFREFGIILVSLKLLSASDPKYDVIMPRPWSRDQ